MTGGARLRGLADVVTRLGGEASDRGASSAEPGVEFPVPERLVPTRAIGILVDVLRGRRSPVVLDLGRVVGGNVGFLTAELGCKLIVADLFADLDLRASNPEATEDAAGAWITARIGHDANSMDAVLCWDTLEHLTANEVRVLASRLTRVLTSREVMDTFAELAVVDTFLLATRAYEMLFRKPSQSTVNRKGMASPGRREV